MQNLGLTPTFTPNSSPPGFWRRQFRPSELTAGQTTFDVVFGIFLPLICFAADPIVFKGGLGDYPVLYPVRIFAYSLAAASIVCLAIWLIFRESLQWLNGFLSGLFILGGTISLILGLILFPFSFVGMLLIIGVLGYTPLFCGVVYLRNGYRAYAAASPALIEPIRRFALIFGIVMSLWSAVWLNSRSEEISDFLGFPQYTVNPRYDD
jgi:hypothetical protein